MIEPCNVGIGQFEIFLAHFNSRECDRHILVFKTTQAGIIDDVLVHLASNISVATVSCCM